MSLPRMMHADVQFQIYRLEQMAMGGALAFNAEEIRNACHLIRTLATELDATAVPVVVGEDMVERAYSAYGQRCWSRGETASAVTKEDMRAALTAALAGD